MTESEELNYGTITEYGDLLKCLEKFPKDSGLIKAINSQEISAKLENRYPFKLHDLEITNTMINNINDKVNSKFLENTISKLAKKQTTKKTKDEKSMNFKIKFETKPNTPKRKINEVIIPYAFSQNFVDEHTSHQRWIWL